MNQTTDTLSAVGFTHEGKVDDLQQFRTRIIRQLHSDFVGHPGAGRWKLALRTIGNSADENRGAEIVVVLPASVACAEVNGHLASIMSQHALRPLTAAELQGPVEWVQSNLTSATSAITLFCGNDPELARAAANWWTARFGKRLAVKKTGARALDAVTAQVPAELPHDPQIEAFQLSLEATIAEQLESEGRSYVSVDYDPDRALVEALHAAGMHRGAGILYLPWKSVTQIERGQLYTSGG